MRTCRHLFQHLGIESILRAGPYGASDIVFPDQYLRLQIAGAEACALDSPEALRQSRDCHTQFERRERETDKRREIEGGREGGTEGEGEGRRERDGGRGTDRRTDGRREVGREEGEIEARPVARPRILWARMWA